MIAVINYGVGNLTSIRNMLKKVGVNSIITSSEADIDSASKIILPGMGHFDNCMEKLQQSGLKSIIEKKVKTDKVPVLGICVGLQMFMKSSEEGNEPGLNWIEGETIRFRKDKMPLSQKIPNMGWLELTINKPSKLLENLADARFYFAHSYHVLIANEKVNLLSAEYGYSFTAAIEHDNILGVQFHPEKSHRFGMKLLKNFATNY
jgi:imidazole glycerol-phosphate synthase subunit HisH